MVTETSNFLELYQINISEKIGNEYIPMINDLVRMIILQVTVQFMLFLRNPTENSLFDTGFIEILLYIILGLCVYWLVFKRLIKIK